VAVWILSALAFNIAFWNLGIFSISGVSLVWTFVEMVAATVAGAWLYREEAA